MDEIRKLVFENKKRLNDFGIKQTGSLNNLIYYAWLMKRTEIDPFEGKYRDYYLKTFNDAYYVCTLALLLPNGLDLNPSVIMGKIERPSLVFPMVHLYLSRLTVISSGIRCFLDIIETKFKITPDWGQNFYELQKAVSMNEESIDPSIFAQRKLTKEILSKIDWGKVTNEFKKEQIELIVRNYARNNKDWNLMCEAIKAAAQKYDYDFGFEDYIDEGIDEDGPYTRIVKIPIDPYDIEGNERLEPLKRAGVYQFCDELKERYEELVLEAQPTEDKNGSTKTKEQLVDITWNDKSTNMRKSKVIDKLPDVLNIDIARSIFSKCIMNGWIEDTESGFHWLGLKNCRGRIAQLAYLCGKIYGFEYDKVRPIAQIAG